MMLSQLDGWLNVLVLSSLDDMKQLAAVHNKRKRR